MKKKIFSLLAAFTLVCCAMFSSVPMVFAEDGVSSSTVTLSPMYQKIILIPGETYRASVKISSPSSAEANLEYKASVGSFSQHGEEGSKDDYSTFDVASKTNYNQIVDWIVLDKESGSVAPNTTDELSFSINVPSDAPGGGQYATIIIEDITKHKSNGGNINIEDQVQMASIIYAEVTGDTRVEGLIIENSLPSFVVTAPLVANSMVRNNGNVHTEAKYVLQVWPLFSDEEICTNEEDPITELILPETSRYYDQKCNLPSIGIFRAKQTVEIFGETSITEKMVIVCPIWLIFIILFVIFASIFYFVAKAKARKKAAKRTEKTA